MLRSKTYPKKRTPQYELWCYPIRLPRDLEARLKAHAKERGASIQDEFELAVRAHLKVPVPERYLPETRTVITPFEKMIMRMRRRNGEKYKSIAADYGVTWQYVRSVISRK
jgi:hypothetical protein